MRLFNNYVMLLGLLLLVCSCGFRLRGYNNTDYKFPFQKVYVTCDNVVICPNLKTVIRTDDLAVNESSPESADVTIKLLNEQTSRDAQGFNSAGRIAAFVLTYQVQAQVYQKGNQIGDTINVQVQSTMQYNDATILSNNQEEVKFWDDLHVNATNQLVRRLVYFKSYKTYSTDDSESK